MHYFLRSFSVLLGAFGWEMLVSRDISHSTWFTNTAAFYLHDNNAVAAIFHITGPGKQVAKLIPCTNKYEGKVRDNQLNWF